MLPIRKTLITTLIGVFCMPFTALGQDQNRPFIKVIDPDKNIATANAAARDTEHVEFGLYVGILSVEDFNTNSSIGFSARYFIKENIFVEGNYGRSSTKRANPEGSQNFNPDRTFSYIGIAAGYQMLKGRSFLGKKRKYNTGLYAVGGLESIKFADESTSGAVLGLSYKTILTDLVTVNLDFKNHIFNRSFLNDDKLTLNPEMIIGFNLIF